MEQRRPGEALAAYRRSLELYPNRFNSLRGAERAAAALQDYEGYAGLTITIGAVLTLFALMQMTGRIAWEEVFGSGSRLPAPGSR